MANNVTPQIIILARRILLHEIALGPPSPATAQRADDFRVFENLRIPLGKLMGNSGYRLLVARARSLAAIEYPWLLSLEIDARGSFSNISEARQPHGAQYIMEGEVMLVAHIFGLLVTFIGAPLTTRIVQGIWPRLNDLPF